MIFDRVIPLELREKKTRNFQFPLSNFCRDVCIRLKLYMEIFYQKILVKFEFGPDLLIFVNYLP
jgi:hypothetical protein